MKEKKHDIYLGFVLLVFSILIFVGSFSIRATTTMTVGPDFVPKLVAVGLAACSVFLIVSSWREYRAGAGQESAENADGEPIVSKRFFITVGMIVAYFLLFKPVGYLVSTLLYLFFQFMFMTDRGEWKRKWIFCLVLSVILSVGTYYIFHDIFHLMLPEGLLYGIW